jgi:hypothetical protein
VSSAAARHTRCAHLVIEAAMETSHAGMCGGSVRESHESPPLRALVVHLLNDDVYHASIACVLSHSYIRL